MPKQKIFYLTSKALKKYKSLTHGFSIKPIKKLKEISKILDIDLKTLTYAEQIHKDKIVLIDKTKRGRFIKNADALITNLKKTPLAIKTADCLPIFIFDPKTKSIGLIHSGWRGSFLNIAGKTIRRLKKIFKTKEKDILVWIAPAIGVCCYKVGNDLIEALKGKRTDWKKFIKMKNDNYFLDLKKLNYHQLLEAGIPSKNILISRMCTSCNKDLFYSYRRDGKNTGRMFGIIMLN